MSGSINKLTKMIPDFSTVFGGYTSVPLGVFTKINRKPLFVHEQNSVPGLGNRYLSKLSKVVFITFPHAERFFKKQKVVLSGLPLREEVKRAKNLKREEVLNKLRLEDRFTLTVVGGSQGAKTLNGLALEIAQKLDIQIIHLCGERNYEELKREYQKLKPRARVKLLPFYLNMGEIFKITDFAVSRSGASTSFELSYFGIPAIFIPYPYAVYDHQYHNARYFVEGKGAYLFREEELNPQRVIEIVENHLKDPKLHKQLSENMEKLFIPDAEVKMWETIREKL
jgi:UDP-N-acetylglucosamine--N-acetylmuramyl-(pentapeptide) pyrophosphoryl-undecaprenol N-acetylglucosamine transferase